MSKGIVISFFSLTILTTSLGFASDQKAPHQTTASPAEQLTTPLPLLPSPGEKRTLAYLYEDRTEYYDSALVKDIKKAIHAPSVTENGVQLTQAYVVKFEDSAELYLVQRGWDEDGNCQVVSSPFRVKSGRSKWFANARSNDEVEPGETTHTCSGDPCSNCSAYSPKNGCRCLESGATLVWLPDSPGETTQVEATRCNHSVSTSLE